MRKLLFTITSCFIVNAQAITFGILDTYDLAERYDMTYQNARETYNAARELININRAPLLPQILATGNYTHSHQVTPGNTSSNTQTYSLTLQQTIFDYSSYATYGQSKDNVKAAYSTYIGAQQDLILNLATAYFDVLQNYDELEFQKKSTESFFEFQKQTNARFKVGQDTISDVYIAKANYDNAKAALITAKNNISTSKDNLFNIINTNFDDLYKLKNNIPFDSLESNDSEYWVRQAEINNPEIKTSYYQMLSAKKNISINYGAHYPTINLAASFGTAKAEGTEWQLTWSVGLNGSINLYTGGSVTALTEQSQFNYIVARENYKFVQRTTRKNVIAAHRTIKADIEQTKALKVAVEAAKKSTDSARKAYNVGTENSTDVTKKIAQEFQTRSDYSLARHTYFLDRLRLKRLVGNLHRADIIYINNLLEKK